MSAKKGAAISTSIGEKGWEMDSPKVWKNRAWKETMILLMKDLRLEPLGTFMTEGKGKRFRRLTNGTECQKPREKQIDEGRLVNGGEGDLIPHSFLGKRRTSAGAREDQLGRPGCKRLQLYAETVLIRMGEGTDE